MAEPTIGCRLIGWVDSMSTFFVPTSPTQDKAGFVSASVSRTHSGREGRRRPPRPGRKEAEKLAKAEAEKKAMEEAQCEKCKSAGDRRSRGGQAESG